MELWCKWLSVVNELECAFSRKRTFFWFVIVLIGFTIKFDALGVTSLARGVGLLPSCYTSMLHFFTSKAVDLEKLQRLWVSVVFKCFGGIVRINNRCVIAGDGIKIGKEGKKMPAVKWLHQSSESNSKAEYITGHSIQAVALIVQGLSTYFAVPLAARVHEGIRPNNQDTRTLLDKLFEMVVGLSIPDTFYLVLDKYYCSGKFMRHLVSKNIHIGVLGRNPRNFRTVFERFSCFDATQQDFINDNVKIDDFVVGKNEMPLKMDVLPCYRRDFFQHN